MAEEKMMNEVIETETNEEFDCEYSEESGGGFGKVVGGLVGSAVLAAGTAVIVKNRDRISDFRLKRKIKEQYDKTLVCSSLELFFIIEMV